MIDIAIGQKAWKSKSLDILSPHLLAHFYLTSLFFQKQLCFNLETITNIEKIIICEPKVKLSKYISILNIDA